MTGLELLEGLSFVDAKYIQEAETADLHRNAPWMKVLSVAACLCILIAGVYAYSWMQPKGATESILEDAAGSAEEAAPETATEACAFSAQAEAGEVAAGELQHISAATLRIVSVEDDRWIAVVEEVSDESTAFAVGMRVTVIIDADRAAEAGKEDQAMYGGILLPEEGLLAKIENGTYDADVNILYVAGAILEELPA